MYDTFFSYSHRDKDRAIRVKEYLDKAGLNVWMDRERISLGGSVQSSISGALRDSRSITPILTQHALDSDEVFKEVKYGIDTGIKIIPVVLNPSHFIRSNKSKRWRNILSEVNWGLIDGSTDNRNITAEILSDIEKAIRHHDERRCPVLCVYHFKGGVGKTTICAHLAAQLYQSERRLSVLVIDCDAQSNLSLVFLTRKRLDQLSLESRDLIGLLETQRLYAEYGHFSQYDVVQYDVVRGQVDNSAIHQVQATLHIDSKTNKRLAIVPNNIAATKYSTIQPEQRGWVYQNFQNAIQKFSYEYDIILLDCNPSATLLSECALGAATDIIVPLRNDKYTTDGLENIDTLLGGNYQLKYSYGEGRDQKQLWTLINFADSARLNMPNEQRSLGGGAEADLLEKIFYPIQGGQDLSRFRPSLLNTRIPDSGFLMSKPVQTAPLDPDHPPTRNILSFFGNMRAKTAENAIRALATEVYECTRSKAMMVAV